MEFNFRYVRADLATPGGAERVYAALVRRAGKACTLPRPGSPGLRFKDEDCVAGLVEKTVRKIGAELLIAQWQRSRPATPSVEQGMALR